MSTSTRSRSGGRLVTRLAVVAVSTIAVVVGLPILLVAAAARRFDHASPLHGMTAPWRWSMADVRSWGDRLIDGLDSSPQLVDLFFRCALVIGWVCVAVLIYTVVDESVFQLRHGMPSARHRRLGGLGPLGRKLATVLVAVLPLAVSASPTLAGSTVARPAAGVARHPDADLGEPSATAVAMPRAVDTTTTSVLGGGWSVVEVKRGDSVWAIAERVADGRNVAAVAQQIVAANLGTVMSDGHRFSTPALIEPGWLLDVPVASTAVALAPAGPFPVADVPGELVALEGSYVVVAGDSYWEIAEDHLDPLASDLEVAVYTEELMHINSPVLGYSDERLIRPGDVVQLGGREIQEAAPVLTPVATSVETPPVVADALPSIVVGLPAPTGAPTTVAAPPSPLPPPTPVSVASPAPVAIGATITAAADDWSSGGLPIKRGLAAAVLLAGGAIAVLDSRRRQQLRSACVGARLIAPTEQEVETEAALRSLTAADRLARLDLALRCAAPGLARQHVRALAVEIADDGEIRLYTDRHAMELAQHWLDDVEAGTWRLPARVTLAELADDARRANQPCPAIVHIGESAGGQLFVDLEAVGVLTVDAEPAVAASIVRCAAASLAVSPFAESARVFTVGVGVEVQLGSLTVESHDSVTAAVDAVRTTVGSIATATSGTVTTFALRASARGGEVWEPSLLLAIGADDPHELALLVSLARGGGRGVGAMVDRSVAGSGAALRADGADFVLEPLGLRVVPVGLSEVDLIAVDNLLESAERSLIPDLDTVLAFSPITVAEFVEHAHQLVVHVLGHVAVQTGHGEPVGFDRSKALELVVWLSQHRHRPTRTSARTALWDLAVRDATFSNVVSDARRAMAKVVAPPPGHEWIGRTMNEDLPLHDLVVSDAELLADRVAAARGLDAGDAIDVLRPGVALIHGMPFAGTSYLWPDAEGITSALVLLATSAAGELAAHYLAIGDIDGVFWATGQGLKVLAGHEALIALRMRAHAYRGDLAGVRSEWDSYERAVNADTWAAAEPSPKLVDLRRELLSPSLAS